MNKLALVFATLFFAMACAHKETSQPATAETSTPAKTDASAAATPPLVKTADNSLHPRGIDFGAIIKTVAFGSSANQEAPQPLWKTIGETL